jgi:hypothetical protein
MEPGRHCQVHRWHAAYTLGALTVTYVGREKIEYRAVSASSNTNTQAATIISGCGTTFILFRYFW